MAFARGEVKSEERDVLRGTRAWRPISTYPVGTSAVQAPFLAVGGLRLAALPSLLSLIGRTLQRLSREIYTKTPDESVPATTKFICEAFGRRHIIQRQNAHAEDVARIVSGGEQVYIAFVDRPMPSSGAEMLLRTT